MIGTTRTRTTIEQLGQRRWFVFVVSAVLFLIHKMEGRLPGSSAHPDRYPDWHRQMPGLLVSHEPFDTLLNMALTLTLQVTVTVLVMWLLRRALLRIDAGGAARGSRFFAAAFSVFWLGWGYFETHHIEKLLAQHDYVPGSIFATLFVLWIFLVLLPTSLYHHLCLQPAFEPATAAPEDVAVPLPAESSR